MYARHVWAIASSVGWTLLAAAVCASAAAQQRDLVDLSSLEFAPSVASRAIAAAEPRPEPDVPLRSSALIGQDMLELAKLIAAEQEREGQFSLGLRSYLISLASLYQEVGDHIAAIGTLEKARQIVRVNNGLSSLDQAELALRKITSLEALGQRELAALERNWLIELARRHPTDLRVAAIYAAVADARVAVVEHWVASQSGRPIIVDSSHSGMADDLQSYDGSARDDLVSAQLLYVDALRATAANGSPGGPSVYELESSLMKTFYLQAQMPKLFFGSDVTPYRARKMLDEVGSTSYERRVKYSTLLGRPAAEIARYLVELGDWHLLFREDEAGMEAYREARNVLIEAGASDAEIDALFMPDRLLLIPVFAPQLVDNSAAAEYDGYFDVAIDVNRYGRSKGVQVTAESIAPMSKVTTAAIAARLDKHIEKSQFRPRFVNGELTGGQRVELRYYIKY